MSEEQTFTVLPNGDIEAFQLYKGNPVVIQLDGEDIIIGTQPDYKVKQIILKDKIKTLHKFLTEQKAEIQKRIDAANKVVEDLKSMDLDKMAKAIIKLPKDKPGQKKMQALNQLAEQYYMKQGAIDNLVILEKNVVKFDEQLEFMAKLI